MQAPYKIVIIGASTLLGKELNETLADSSYSLSNFVLADEEEKTGQFEAVGDELALIQRIEPSLFERADFVFFAGGPASIEEHAKSAQQAGASIVDMTGASEQQTGVLLRAPWLEDLGQPGAELPSLTTPAVVSPNPAAIALALLMQRIGQLGAVRSASATVLEPASQYGRAAMDELHQQTLTLLNFQSLPRAIYDTQVAFNATPVFGEAARFSLQESEARVRRHYAKLSADRTPLSIQMVHAPVFHGYSFSLAIELAKPVELGHAMAALEGEHVDVILDDADAPTNLSSSGQSEIMVRVRSAEGETKNAPEAATSRLWIWATLDNLKIACLNAMACAQELERLRPRGKVQ